MANPTHPCFLLPGWSFLPDMWQPLIEQARQAGLDWQRLIPLDGVAFGRWLHSEETFADWLGHEVRGYDLIGWSLGGQQIIEAVASGRCQPRRATVLCASPRFLADPDTGWPGVPAAQLRALRRQVSKNPAQALVGFDAAFGLHLPLRARCEDPVALLAGLDDLARWDHRPWLADCPPVLHGLYGTADRLLPDLTWLPHGECAGRIRTIPGAGHDLPFTQRAALLAQIYS